MKTTLLNTKPFCRKTVVAIGKFDGVHIGHAKLLETAAKMAQCLNISAVAYITDNPAVQKLMPEDERRTIFRNLGTDAVCTDELTDEYKRMTPAQFVHKILGALGACHVVVGYNFRMPPQRRCSHTSKIMCRARHRRHGCGLRLCRHKRRKNRREQHGNSLHAFTRGDGKSGLSPWQTIFAPWHGVLRKKAWANNRFPHCQPCV